LSVVYSASGDEYLRACAVIREKTPASAKILLLYEQRGLYISRDYRIGTPYFQASLFTPAKNFHNELPHVLQREKFTHILVRSFVIDLARMPNYLGLAQPVARSFRWVELRALRRVETIFVGEKTAYVLYEVVDPSHPMIDDLAPEG